MTFGKAFPLKSERRQILFRAEMYNIFNHTQFTAANIAPTYSWPLWQTGVLQQTNANLGRYTAAANPRRSASGIGPHQRVAKSDLNGVGRQEWPPGVCCLDQWARECNTSPAKGAEAQRKPNSIAVDIPAGDGSKGVTDQKRRVGRQNRGRLNAGY